MFDKDCVGDVSAVQALIPNLTSNGDNWIKGSLGKFKICAKVFAVGSDYGIKNGRISKIQICDTSQEHWGFEQTYLNYDRGWDMYPKDDDTIEFINKLLAAFGDDILTDDDLVWYEIYGYREEEDFEACEGREYLISLDSMDAAIVEARGWITDDNKYEVIKVISNDSEEIEILKREDNHV